MHQADSQEEDIAKLLHMAREFTEGFNSGDLDRIMHFYDDTYVDVNLRRPVQTKQERRAYFAQVMRRAGIRIDVQPDEIRVEDNFAFVRGRIKVTRTEVKSGAAGPTELRYMEIARKHPDGTWKVMWGMDGPVQEYDPAR